MITHNTMLNGYFSALVQSCKEGYANICREHVKEMSKPQRIQFLEWLTAERKHVTDDSEYMWLIQETYSILKK
jgi:hypothetical protein